MESVEVYTRTEFARHIGRTKQWVCDKVRRHRKLYDEQLPFELTASDGTLFVVKLVKSGKSSILIKPIETIRP